MRLLLDTNALIWSIVDRQRLTSTATDLLEDEANDVFVSVISVWEIEIKAAKGKLRAPADLQSALAAQSFKTLPVAMHHVYAVESLPRHHRDPFDRMLICQAQLDDLVLVTSDRMMQRYPIAVLPAV